MPCCDQDPGSNGDQQYESDLSIPTRPPKPKRLQNSGTIEKSMKSTNYLSTDDSPSKNNRRKKTK